MYSSGLEDSHLENQGSEFLRYYLLEFHHNLSMETDVKEMRKPILQEKEHVRGRGKSNQLPTWKWCNSGALRAREARAWAEPHR